MGMRAEGEHWLAGVGGCEYGSRARACPPPPPPQQSFRFINGKNEACFHMKRNPRKINWTLFYRRLRKKGTQVRLVFSLPAACCDPPPRETHKGCGDLTMARWCGESDPSGAEHGKGMTTGYLHQQLDAVAPRVQTTSVCTPHGRGCARCQMRLVRCQMRFAPDDQGGLGVL